MGSDDDFLVPTNVDLDEKCGDIKHILLNQSLLRILAILSIICNMYLMWMYFILKTPVLKRHPTCKNDGKISLANFILLILILIQAHSNSLIFDLLSLFYLALAIYRCILDLLFYQQYLWAPSVRTELFYSDDFDKSPYYCNASWQAAIFAFLTQFSFLGGELCFFIISVDLRWAYTNPFTSIRQNWRKFALFVVVTSLVFAFALIAMGPRVYGVAINGTIWIQDRRADDSVSWGKILLYYSVIIAIYTYCLWANFQFSRTNEKGFSRTLSNRLSIMHRSRRFVVGYILFDSMILGLVFASFILDSSSELLIALSAYSQACRGVWNTLIIVYSNWSEVTWDTMWPFRLQQPAQVMVASVAMEKLMLQPHLNTALRAEVLFFTTQGIMLAARDSEHQRLKHLAAAAVGAGASAGAGAGASTNDSGRTTNGDAGSGYEAGGAEPAATVPAPAFDRMYSLGAGGS